MMLNRIGLMKWSRTLMSLQSLFLLEIRPMEKEKFLRRKSINLLLKKTLCILKHQLKRESMSKTCSKTSQLNSHKEATNKSYPVKQTTTRPQNYQQKL